MNCLKIEAHAEQVANLHRCPFTNWIPDYWELKWKHTVMPHDA